MTVKQLKKQLVAAICSVAVAAVALGSSTYAWYVNNTQVTATDVRVSAATVYNLMIKRVAEGNYGTTCALNGSRTLTPVSTLGELQNSNGSLGINPYDGSDNSYEKDDVRFVTSNIWNSDGVVDTFTEVGKNTLALLTDTSSITAPSRMYYQDSVYLMAGQTSRIYFDYNSTGIYNSSTNTLTKFGDVVDNQTVSLLKTMRVGLMVTKNDGKSDEAHAFYVYQIIGNLIDATGATSHTTTKKYGTYNVDGVSYSAGVSGVGIPNFASLLANGQVPLIMDCTANGKSGGLADISSTSQPLASVTAGEEIKVDIYLWMEGCDYDTTAANSEAFSTQIDGIQFGFCIGAPQ